MSDVEFELGFGARASGSEAIRQCKLEFRILVNLLSLLLEITGPGTVGLLTKFSIGTYYLSDMSLICMGVLSTRVLGISELYPH